MVASKPTWGRMESCGCTTQKFRDLEFPINPPESEHRGTHGPALLGSVSGHGPSRAAKSGENSGLWPNATYFSPGREFGGNGGAGPLVRASATDALFSTNQMIASPDKPARGPAADQGVRPTICPGTREWEKYVALGILRLAAGGPFSRFPRGAIPGLSGPSHQAFCLACTGSGALEIPEPEVLLPGAVPMPGFKPATLGHRDGLFFRDADA